MASRATITCPSRAAAIVAAAEVTQELTAHGLQNERDFAVVISPSVPMTKETAHEQLFGVADWDVLTVVYGEGR